MHFCCRNPTSPPDLLTAAHRGQLSARFKHTSYFGGQRKHVIHGHRKTSMAGQNPWKTCKRKKMARGAIERFAIAAISSRQLSVLCSVYAPVIQSSAQPTFQYEQCQNHKGNYTTNSTYQGNLNRVLSILPSRGNGNGFYNSSYGRNSDKVYATGLCRGDIEPNGCRNCLVKSAQILTLVCPNKKEAIGGFDECMLRCSNLPSLGVMETSPIFHSWSTESVSSIYLNGFFRDLRILLDELKNRAAAGGPLRKYATGNTSAPEFQIIYALAQCRPDLSQLGCNNCLDKAFQDIPRYYGKVGGRVVTPSCNFRYEVYRFYGHAYDAPPATQPPPPPLTEAGATIGKKSNTSGNSIIVVATAATAVLIISLGVYSRVKKSYKKVEDDDDKEEEVEFGTADCLRFDFRTVRVATGNFSERNKIGQSVHGPVYRGKLRSTGQQIAVKRFYKNGLHIDYFKNEVLLLSRLQHRNVVRLLGFCLKENERLLVYEFPKMSLDDLLSAEHEHLAWETRYKIIRGIAQGLLYLHEDSRLRIIHYDLNASNIWLDEDMNPKISDFGVAKLIGVYESEDTRKLLNTVGYIAAKYLRNGPISTEVDVFSFGQLILEIASGRTCGFSEHRGEDYEHPLVSYARRNWREGTLSNLVDPQMKDGPSKLDEILRCVDIGMLCIQESAADRPTMSSVVHMLNCDLFHFP
ncbi:cysteine-rich receptor-like protein kinase 26 isoform X3 [Morus notabilis]|uniref:cysteine-rich receptor-like protein kinase 26 isoform X3 n=1 Tax=Morus notabilis TaxID=981085 RepID=UPI000CED2F6F|nr:cysteine-rich receptor-like protein kinase 26 isoform X3 [Morus notabilis]